MQLCCSRYGNSADHIYWRLMRLCYVKPSLSERAQVWTKIAPQGAQVVLGNPRLRYHRGTRLLDSGHLAPLSPSYRLRVPSLSLYWHFWPPVAPLSLACCFPVALLSLPCRSPGASLSLSCRPPDAILSPPVASCCFLSPGYFLPDAFLSLSCRSPVVPSCRSPVAISCCLPVALLSLACPLPVASLSPPCRLPVASRLPNVVPCCSLVACLSLACHLHVAFLSPPCRLLVASLSPNVLPYSSPVAFLWLACRFLVGCLSPTSRLPVTYLPGGVQSNDANRRSLVQTFALFDNPEFLTLLVIYYAHLHGRSAVGSQRFCISN